MKVLIVHAHHEPQSFNAALTHHAKQVLTEHGHEVVISDLYAMGFDPISDRRNFTTCKDPTYFKQQTEELHATEADGFAPDIQTELDKLFWCDVLIFQFPLWWFGLPAILKGWVDRVFAMGKTYGGGRWYSNGVLKGRRAMLSITTGGPETIYSPHGINGDIEQILFPIHHGIFYFTGFEVLPPFIAWAASRAGDDGRRAYLDHYSQRLLTLETTPAIPYATLEDYDPQTLQLKAALDTTRASMATVKLAVNGTLMRGLELNPNLLNGGATFVEETTTEPCYRLWSIADRHPAMVRVQEGGRAIAVEVWAVPTAGLVTILLQEPPGLTIGNVRLSTGETVLGILGEPALCEAHPEITQYGGWRAYLAAHASQPPG